MVPPPGGSSLVRLGSTRSEVEESLSSGGVPDTHARNLGLSGHKLRTDPLIDPLEQTGPTPESHDFGPFTTVRSYSTSRIRDRDEKETKHLNLPRKGGDLE